MAREKAIVVLGATGNQGSCVLKHLHAAETPNVTCVTRNPGEARAIQMRTVFAGIEMAVGDFEDPQSISGIVKDASRQGTREVHLFMISTPCLASTGMSFDAANEEKTAKAIIDAAKKVGVKHIAFSSATGCDKKTAPSSHAAKKAIEEYLKASGVAWTILRPASFFEIAARLYPVAQGVVTGVCRGHVKQQWVSLDDLGAAGASALLFPDKFQGKTLDIVGDELSGDEMAEQLGHLRKETFVYKVSWVWRLMMMYFAAGVYEQGVEFPEKHGGGNGDSTVFARMAADFPDAFQRKIVMNYERFCKRYQLVERALPPASQGASSVLVALAIVGGAVAAAVALLPETFVNEMKRRWAFYGLVLLVVAGLFLRLVNAVRK